jgi:Zn-dependent protease with chaperone function
MTESTCLLLYGAAVALFMPLLLTRLWRNGWAPMLGVRLWLLAALSVLVAWCAALVLAYRDALAETRVALSLLLAAACGRIGWALASTAHRSRRWMTRHRDGIQMAGRRDDRLGAIVIDSQHAIVYCVPGRQGIVVLTTAARAQLTPAELAAALAHERAHLAGHHHAVMLTTRALARTVPFLPLFSAIERNVSLLLEMRADDHAARAYGRSTVVRAITVMALASAPAGALGAGGASAVMRAKRLDRPTAGPGRLISAALSVTSIVVAAGGPVLVTIDPLCG